jgi:hypothetical protein
VVFYLVGQTAGAALAATVLKVVLLIPLGLVGLRCLLGTSGAPPWRVPELTLALAFALYLGAFIWLDMVWEASLAIVIFAYLLATLEQPHTRILTWVVFLPYALVDVWQVISLGLFGMDVIAPGPYVVTDPSIYIPMIMIVILAFYTLLIGQAWKAAPAHPAAGARVWR